MTVENFERFAQGKLGGYRSKVDAEALWSQVSSELHPPKKRGFFWLWFSAGMLVLLTAGYLSWPQGQPELPNKSNMATVLPTSSESNSEAHSNGTATAAQKESIKGKISIDNEGHSETNSSTKTNQKNDIYSGEYGSPTASNDARKSVTTISQNQTLGQQVSKNIFESKIEEKVFPLPSSDTFDIENKPMAGSQSIFSPTTSELVTENVNEIIQDIDLTVESTESIMIEEKEEGEEKIVEDLKSPTAPPVSSFARDLTLGFGLRGGIANSLTSFRTYNGAGDTLLDLRYNSETSLETFSVGVEALVKHDIGFYASIGADYSKYTRRMDFNEEIVMVDSVQGITRIIVNPITMVETYDTGLVARTTTTSSIKEIYNTHEFINIPITLGYSFGYENWSIGLEAGALININTKFKGLIRDSENTFYDVGKDERNWFTNNVGASFRGALVLGYAFDEAFQIYLGPEFRSPVKIEASANPLKQQQSSLGFQLGARYWLAY